MKKGVFFCVFFGVFDLFLMIASKKMSLSLELSKAQGGSFDLTGYAIRLFLWVLIAIFSIGFFVSVIITINTYRDNKKKRSIENSTDSDKIVRTYSVPSAPAQSESLLSNDLRPTLDIPEQIGDLVRIYHYTKIRFSPCSDTKASAMKMKTSNNWEITPKMEDDKISLYFYSVKFGDLIDKADIVKDWLNRNDVVKCWLENFGDSGNYIALAFYREEQKRLANHPSTVVRLTRYSNEDAQFAISLLKDGAMLDFEESRDYEDPEDTVYITYGDSIGALPKTTAKKYLEEGAAAVFLDHVDYDVNKEKDIPYVKIYW